MIYNQGYEPKFFKTQTCGMKLNLLLNTLMNDSIKKELLISLVMDYKLLKF